MLVGISFSPTPLANAISTFRPEVFQCSLGRYDGARFMVAAARWPCNEERGSPLVKNIMNNAAAVIDVRRANCVVQKKAAAKASNYLHVTQQVIIKRAARGDQTRA